MRHLFKIIQAVVLITVSFFTTNAQCSPVSIDSTIAKIAAKHRKDYTGFAVGIIRHNQVVYQKGFGYADKQKKIPCTDTTIMEVASISKAIVGMAIVKLIEEGYCTLDSPVNSLLPFAVVNPFSPGEPITLRQVVTHTSGIHDSKLFLLRTMQYTDQRDPDVALRNFVQSFLSPTGKWYSKNSFTENKNRPATDYSNLNAALAAVIIESVTKMSFTEFCRKTIFDKLDMHQTGWLFSELQNTKIARKYTRHGVALKQYTIRSYPSSTLYTSVADMLKLMPVVMSKDSSHRVFQNSTSIDLLLDHHEAQKRYGVFWKHYGPMVGHSGSNLGISATLRLNPQTGNGYILIFNQTLTGKKANVKDEVVDFIEGMLSF